jgi:hypothetical protein
MRAAKPSLPGRIISTALTFIAVVVAWVFFRSENFASAMLMLEGMTGAAGRGDWLSRRFVVLCGIGLVIVFFAPNTQELCSRYAPAADFYGPQNRFFRLNAVTGSIIGTVLFVSILLLGKHSEFLYFQF